MLSEKTKERIDFIVRIAYFGLVMVIAYIVFRGLWMIWPLVLAFLFSAMFQPLIRFIHRKFKINRKLSAVALMALLYVGIGTLLYRIVLEMVHFLRDFFAGLPALYENIIAPNITEVSNWLQDALGNYYLDVLSEIDINLGAWLYSVAGELSQWGVSWATGFINSIPNILMNILFMILLSFFITYDFDRVVGFIKNQLPTKRLTFLDNVKDLSRSTLFQYLKSYMLIMVITFAELTVGFIIIGVKNPIGVAAAIALFDFLPVLGAGSVIAIWVIVEVLGGNMTFAIGLAVVGIVVTIVRSIIEPKIVGDRFGVSPITVLLSAFLGYRFFGPVGMLLAPIFTQLALVLHKNGLIRLYKSGSNEKESNTKKEENKEQSHTEKQNHAEDQKYTEEQSHTEEQNHTKEQRHAKEQYHVGDQSHTEDQNHMKGQNNIDSKSPTKEQKEED